MVNISRATDAAVAWLQRAISGTRSATDTSIGSRRIARQSRGQRVYCPPGRKTHPMAEKHVPRK